MTEGRRGVGWAVGKGAFAAIFLVAGVAHFRSPDLFAKIMPPSIPHPRAMVLISGAFEVALGACLLIPRTSRVAAWGLIALLIAVFPANVHMYRHAGDFPGPPIVYLIRLPIQGLLIWWAYRYARDPARAAPRPATGRRDELALMGSGTARGPDTHEADGEAGGDAAAPGRILGYDLARSLALLGMFVVHFGLVMASDPSRPAWARAVLDLLDGRAAATFVVLAGVGLSLRSRRAPAPGFGKALVRRGLVLLAIGFANLAIWPGDILRVYGVSLILAVPFVLGSGRRLLLAALGFVLGFPVLMGFLDYGAHWDWATMTYRQLWTPGGIARNLFYDGFRSVFPWTGLLFYGIWLGRLDLRDRATSNRVLLGAGAAVVFAGVVSRACLAHFARHPGGLDEPSILALFGTISMPPLPLFLLSAGGLATFAIALCVRLAESCPAAPWLGPMASTGQMALTWYVAHIVIGLGTVEQLGLATSRPLPVGEACGAGFFAAAVLGSWLWKSRFRHGPLEWAMRRVAG